MIEMDLAQQQRKLLGLIKSRYIPTANDDPYILDVAQSKQLRAIRAIVVFWRALGIERYCILTSRVLKRRGLFDAVVEDFVNTQDFSPFVEVLGALFVETMSSHPDRLVASVAQFEAAYIKVTHGDRDSYTINWNYEPMTVITGLLQNVPFDEAHIRGAYQTVVSHDSPGFFTIVEVQPRY